ncbi:MAG: type 4a pilus biogenesis protein PilO [Burkholderiaceae bacterium]|nr:type 4a pilus biogenesis protein PilO [Burkholderiaceae bacterium]
MGKFNPKIDFSGLSAQFAGLQGRHPGLWPALPKVALLLGVAAAVLGIAYVGYWRGQLEDLDARVQEETRLKAEFVQKMKQAVNLEVLRKQKEQVSQYVNQLEKQLPSKAEMDALLSDINQAGVGRGLQFELFKPGQVVVRDYYAELPIAIKLSGNYHDFGAFTSDIANLPRIVTLNDMRITLPDRAANTATTASDSLVMEATAKTFRYLDPEEVAEQRARAAAEAKAGKKPNPGAAKK